MTIPLEIQELVDRPTEALHIELKEWLNLKEPAARAKTAKHLAALANHGGGYFILGIRDDLTLDPAHPGNLQAYSRDHFAGIIDKYLTPAFQCDVFVVAPSAGGSECIVVRVPSHGTVPVCARSNGPDDDKGRSVGVRKGEHYIRVPGPKSVEIDSAELWQPLIRRCVMNDHQHLLESFGRVLRPSEPASPLGGVSLKDWHDGFRKQFEEVS